MVRTRITEEGGFRSRNNMFAATGDEMRLRRPPSMTVGFGQVTAVSVTMRAMSE